jgi:hypothetical protein
VVGVCGLLLLLDLEGVEGLEASVISDLVSEVAGVRGVRSTEAASLEAAFLEGVCGNSTVDTDFAFMLARGVSDGKGIGVPCAVAGARSFSGDLDGDREGEDGGMSLDGEDSREVGEALERATLSADDCWVLGRAGRSA